MTPAHSIRHRIAADRDRLIAELANLKPGSSIAKIVKGRLLQANADIDMCDQELLALEQGRAQIIGHAYNAKLHDGGPIPGSLSGYSSWEKQSGEPETLRPDQLAWLGKRRGE